MFIKQSFCEIDCDCNGALCVRG